MKRLVTVCLSAALGLGAPAFAEDQAMINADAFAPVRDQGGPAVDYQVLSDILRGIVLNVPESDRIPQRGRPISTGTRISTANLTRYRFEANRVIFHMLNDEYQAAITEYRRELENLPNQIDLARLNRDEQLAYWLNLHNIAVIEQIMLTYPINSISRAYADGTGEKLFEARFLNVAGQQLSLDDIRRNIVYRYWDDPRVIYGFFNGSIGGPDIRRRAYTGETVWRQLDDNAREFVNSMRGVEIAGDDVQRVSSLYAEAAHYFPDFQNDLRAHLLAYADGTASQGLIQGLELRPDVETWAIADLINGSQRCFGGPGDPQIQSTIRASRLTPTRTVRPSAGCAAVPENARLLLDHVFERRIELMREGRYGRVRTEDIDTPDPDQPVLAEPEAETGQ